MSSLIRWDPLRNVSEWDPFRELEELSTRLDRLFGRRALVVPYADEGVVDAALEVGDCCSPSDPEHQCLEGSCAPIPASTRDFFGTFEEDEECEK